MILWAVSANAVLARSIVPDNGSVSLEGKRPKLCLRVLGSAGENTGANRGASGRLGDAADPVGLLAGVAGLALAGIADTECPAGSIGSIVFASTSESPEGKGPKLSLRVLGSAGKTTGDNVRASG